MVFYDWSMMIVWVIQKLELFFVYLFFKKIRPQEVISVDASHINEI